MAVWLRTGRGIPRPVLFGGSAVLLAGLVWTVGSIAGGAPVRGAALVPNPQARPAEEFLVGPVRHLVAPDAPQRLVPDTLFPTLPVRLLWLDGRVAQPIARGGAVTLDGAGGVIWFDRRLGLHRWPIREGLGGGEILSVTGAAGDALWLSGSDGTITRLAPDGSARTLPVPGSLGHVALSAEPADPRGLVWLVRHPQRWQYRLPEPRTHLLLRLDSTGAVGDRVGRVVVPPQILLAELASTGHVTAAGDTVYYAPFIRDEVIAFTAAGDTLWVADRQLPQSTPDPAFGTRNREPFIDYHPVNLGMLTGPGGTLYVLSTPGLTTEASRLDVFDRATGRLGASAALPTALPTLAADEEGRVYLIDTFRLLTGIAPEERETFPQFALPLLGGGRMTRNDLKGRVALVNFWASWCHPCREEMPALDSLRTTLETDPGFVFLTMNEDINPDNAEQFVREFGFGFPVLLGRGQLRREFHYIGLPMTVLLDREAKVVQRWSGFAGAEQIGAIGLLVRKELEREEAAGSASEHSAHQGHQGH